jgi:hypothetical protein
MKLTKKQMTIAAVVVALTVAAVVVVVVVKKRRADAAKPTAADARFVAMFRKELEPLSMADRVQLHRCLVAEMKKHPNEGDITKQCQFLGASPCIKRYMAKVKDASTFWTRIGCLKAAWPVPADDERLDRPMIACLDYVEGSLTNAVACERLDMLCKPILTGKSDVGRPWASEKLAETMKKVCAE